MSGTGAACEILVEDSAHVRVHPVELTTVLEALKGSRRDRPAVEHGSGDLVEQRDLDRIHLRPELIDRAHAVYTDLPRRDNVASVDAFVDPEHAAANGIVNERGPFGDVHAANTAADGFHQPAARQR